MIFFIPSPSSDQNSVKNFFHLVSMVLKIDTIEMNIEIKTFQEFFNKVQNNLLEFQI